MDLLQGIGFKRVKGKERERGYEEELCCEIQNEEKALICIFLNGP